MEWNKQNLKSLLLVICGGVAFYCALQNLRLVIAACGWVLGILAPFLLGGTIAFILNVPMRAIERHLYPAAKQGTTSSTVNRMMETTGENTAAEPSAKAPDTAPPEASVTPDFQSFARMPIPDS